MSLWLEIKVMDYWTLFNKRWPSLYFVLIDLYSTYARHTCCENALISHSFLIYNNIFHHKWYYQWQQHAVTPYRNIATRMSECLGTWLKCHSRRFLMRRVCTSDWRVRLEENRSFFHKYAQSSQLYSDLEIRHWTCHFFRIQILKFPT